MDIRNVRSSSTEESLSLQGTSIRQARVSTHLFPPGEYNSIVNGKLHSYRQPVELEIAEGIRVPIDTTRDTTKWGGQCRVCVLKTFVAVQRAS